MWLIMQLSKDDHHHHINLNQEEEEEDQHLCLDKAYNSEQEEQELIKRGYVLHIPIKKRKRDEREKKDEDKNETQRYQIVKNILQKDGL